MTEKKNAVEDLCWAKESIVKWRARVTELSGDKQKLQGLLSEAEKWRDHWKRMTELPGAECKACKDKDIALKNWLTYFGRNIVQYMIDVSTKALASDKDGRI